MIRRDHPAVRAMMEESDYPEHVQREFDAYMAQHVWHRVEDELHWAEQFPPAWHDFAVVAVGAVIVAAVLWSWLS